MGGKSSSAVILTQDTFLCFDTKYDRNYDSTGASFGQTGYYHIKEDNLDIHFLGSFNYKRNFNKLKEEKVNIKCVVCVTHIILIDTVQQLWCDILPQYSEYKKLFACYYGNKNEISEDDMKKVNELKDMFNFSDVIIYTFNEIQKINEWIINNLN